MDLKLERANERLRLRWIATGVVLWLVLAVLVTGLATVALLFAPYDLDSAAYQIVLSVAGSAFSAALSALVAAVTRIAQGWELDSGEVIPAGRVLTQVFSARRVPLYIVRPILGAASGLAFYVVLMALSLVLVQNSDELSFHPVGLLSLAMLVGLFAHLLLMRLRDTFAALFEAREPRVKPFAQAALSTTHHAAAVTVADASSDPRPAVTAPTKDSPLSSY